MKSTYPSDALGEWTVVGTMSGTSLDGLDICVATFSRTKKGWSFEIHSAETIGYSAEWNRKLSSAHRLSPKELKKLDTEYSTFIRENVKAHLLANHTTQIDLMGSHGHTLFHEPEKGITFQLGNKEELKGDLPFPVACDFRVADVKLGGQGAPLVPIGDELLFHEYDVCLNLGGFANLSVGVCKDRLAWDIAPVNITLNSFTQKLGLPFDDGGQIAAQSEVDKQVVEQLNRLAYYHESPPKSLGREWVEDHVLPLVEHLTPESAIATLTCHSAFQIGRALHDLNAEKILCTGGGSYNRFLIEKIEKTAKAKITIPQENIINYKEALIFGFLGLLRYLGEDNVLSNVTGAKHDHCSGVLYD
ncbi:MAG: anhydro-N-acetylmuramic acid kinase [Flavobacteriia bacterium]|nr:anhydro-N-acetylmuramic acid kinase [Flavobacteriia bacterium]